MLSYAELPNVTPPELCFHQSRSQEANALHSAGSLQALGTKY